MHQVSAAICSNITRKVLEEGQHIKLYQQVLVLVKTEHLLRRLGTN